MIIKPTFLFLVLALTIPAIVFSQKITEKELMTILDIKTFRVPSFPKKQWVIDLIPDTLPKRKFIPISKILSSKSTSLIAVKSDNDSALTFTLLQNKNSNSKGQLNLKNSRFDITWNNFPEFLYKNTFVIATINYEQKDGNPINQLQELLIIQLIEELKF